jgi:signal transduction histidine kinase
LLPNGAFLVVGRDTAPVARLHRIIIRGFVLCLVATSLLALGAGMLMSMSVLTRIEAINHASREIRAGRLSQRISTAGKGDEFDELATHLNAMLDRIEVLMEDVRQVSHDIAHDLRTPLTRVRHRLELARMKAQTTAELETAIDQAVFEIDDLLGTFSSLLRIAQIEAGTRRSGFTRVDLSDVMQGVLEIYKPVAEDRGQGLGGSIAAGVCVDGDRALLTQLFANLVENALHHTPPGSSVRLTLDCGKGTAPRAIMADDGPGIPEDMRDRIFKPFVRLDRSRSMRGSGLGLSIVRAIASLHDIDIDLQDNAPGLRMVLQFPSQPTRS